MSDLKFGHFYFFGPPLTSATSEVGWKTSNFNVDFNVEKREEFGIPLCEIINFEHWRLIFINCTKCPTKSLIKK